jgi:hypothetical protein
MSLCTFIFGVLDCNLDSIFRDLCHPVHQCYFKICKKEDPPGIGDDGDIAPLEPLLSVLRDLFSVGVEDMISTLNDCDSNFRF